MKKIFAFILSLTLIFTFAACGSKANTENNGNNESVGIDSISLSDIVSQTASGSDIEFFNFTTETVDSEIAAYLIGAESLDASFSEAIAYIPMMNTNPFTMIVFRVSDDQNAQTLADELESKANLRKLICVEAETADTVVNGNTVLFVMGSVSDTDAIINAFNNL